MGMADRRVKAYAGMATTFCLGRHCGEPSAAHARCRSCLKPSARAFGPTKTANTRCASDERASHGLVVSVSLSKVSGVSDGDQGTCVGGRSGLLRMS